MTIEEARAKYGNEIGHLECSKCPFYGNIDQCPDLADGMDECFKAVAEYYTEQEKAMIIENDTPTVEHNVISQPSHYNREGAMECIDEMILLFGKETVKHFCLCNMWKYRYRASDKNGKEDMEKSDEYMRIYKKLCEE